MSSLASKFLVMLSMILTMFFYIVFFKLSSNTEYEKQLAISSSLVKLPSISLSTSFVDDRILEYKDYKNEFYLGMKKDSYAGFVYAK